MAKLDPEILAHVEWLGFVRPKGLVVSATALVRAGAILLRRDAEGQQRLRDCLEPRSFVPGAEPEPWLPDFRRFARDVLGWSFAAADYAGTAERSIPPELEVPLADGGGSLRPDYAVREPEPTAGGPAWQLLVQVTAPGQDLDEAVRDGGALELSPHSRMERLLRQTRVTAGLLFNGRALRLISAPYGESSGSIDFKVADMELAAGRPICSALRLLLSETQLITAPRAKRLTALLEDSRKYQNEVSERLAEQVLHALYELLRGFQAAHEVSAGELLRQALADDPNLVYRGLLTVVLRLVFLLYAEERGLLPDDGPFLRHYSLAGLFAKLREDAALYPDTLNQRHGAWAQILVLFRMIHDGARSGRMHLPRRHGALFDPDRFRFLEGRAGGARQVHERIEPPRVPDGTIYRALDKLLVLDGERISYRALDVEQIGSVYETMMGFRLERAAGRSVAIKAQKRHGAPTALDLDALLAQPPGARAKWLQEQTDRKTSDGVRRAVVAARTVDDLHAALRPVIDAEATPDVVPPGALVLQPSEERRRSGSHYTPRALTQPIVRTTLDPVLARLHGADGRPPRPEQVLDLKVCDPAMGSGAFLVEACRQLGDVLIEAWRVHGGRPAIPADEDEIVFARRLVVQRCLYGVDRNPMAVDLAKVSLWLVTLARDHALTFLDHALRHGDSLVGLTRRQIEAFHWDGGAPAFQEGLQAMHVREHVARATELRRRIREAGEGVSDFELRDAWDEAQSELRQVRLFGDLVLAAYFDGEKARDREAKRVAYAHAVVAGKAEEHRLWIEERREGEPPLAPFHWDVEFPEVFEREWPGFDAIVGNPPFAGKNSAVFGNLVAYADWLKQLHLESHGNADLVAHFFRRSYGLIRHLGHLGLIATKTIREGDTRTTGLRWICANGGVIYHARRAFKWPGSAAVTVCTVGIVKGDLGMLRELDGRRVDTITAFLTHAGGHENPRTLAANAHMSFEGSIPLGMGFTFDDTDTEGAANPISLMTRVCKRDSRNKERIFPFLGGKEVNESPTHAHHRFIIDFFDLPEREARRWPDLMEIVESKVKPLRDRQKRSALRQRWWQYAEKRPGLYRTIAGKARVLATVQTSKYRSFVLLPTGVVYDQKLIILPLAHFSAFALLQSRVHEWWALSFGGYQGETPVYNPSDCLGTFPSPRTWEVDPSLEVVGKTYYDFRAAIMVRNNEGLTKTYNRFHDPNETCADIHKLRELHADMDRAVLAAYGWSDISTTCEFLLENEMDEAKGGDRKKPWRYRWPDAVRDEVLSRLLELNAWRAAEEARTGAPAAASERTKRSRKAAIRSSGKDLLFP